jgi:peptidoglycan/LPS O-acetylase OafA/YrhL
MRHRAVHVATWLLSRIVSKSERKPLLGDLAEEYALRANTASSSVAFKWYLQQICASAAPLLCARLTRAAWMATVGVALLAYIAVGLVELIVNRAISSSSAISYNPLGLVITFPMVVLIGYFAARFRRRAPIVLGAMMLLAVTVMTVSSTENTPQWYRIAYFFVGLAAALIGSALRSLRPPRS